MKDVVVALDCTGETYSAGVLVGGKHQTSVVGLSPRRALRELPGHIGYLLESAGKGYRDVSAVGVTQGPGSFTGVRLGVTLAKTICQASACGVYGLDTLELLALGQKGAFRDGTVAVALDARRSELYCALYQIQPFGPRLATGVLTPDDFAREMANCQDLRSLVGPGFVAYPELVPEGFLGSVLGSPKESAPPVELLCALTHTACEEGTLTDPGELLPIYHRQADIQVSGTTKA
jgi:tRNA threonylcarbamoyladenosine biosynthesis protein TsaB